MNKKLDSLIGQKAAEKRGKGWALTTFPRETWGSTKEEIIYLQKNYQEGQG